MLTLKLQHIHCLLTHKKTQSFTLFLRTVQKLELQSRSFSLRQAKKPRFMNIVASLSSGSKCTLYMLLLSIGYHSICIEQLETSLSILAGEDVIVRMSTAELSDNIS